MMWAHHVFQLKGAVRGHLQAYFCRASDSLAGGGNQLQTFQETDLNLLRAGLGAVF